MSKRHGRGPYGRGKKGPKGLAHDKFRTRDTRATLRAQDRKPEAPRTGLSEHILGGARAGLGLLAGVLFMHRAQRRALKAPKEPAPPKQVLLPSTPEQESRFA